MRPAQESRAKACELAARMVEAEGVGADAASRLWAYAVFFESYIAHGATWTKKNVIDAPAPAADVLQLVRPQP